MVAIAPALLVIPLDGRPVRFGAPLPAAVVQQGLALQGKGVLQWRRLPFGRPGTDPVWVEIAISGPPGLVRIVPGSLGPTEQGRGPVFVSELHEEVLPHGRLQRRRWCFVDGSVDECTRLEFTAPTQLDGETFAVGEALTTWNGGALERAAVLCRLQRSWLAEVGVLPRVGGGGAATKAVRAHLATLLPLLRELPGRRGAGDYGRSGGVITNNEYDTPFALLRCAVGLADPLALARARRAAAHTLDRDFDANSGLVFTHGLEHRSGAVEPGHTWLRGVLWTGLLTADDTLIEGALCLARGLVSHPPSGTGRNERLRDYASPLLELEAVLALQADPVLALAANRLAASIARRFDPGLRTFRFGEGEVGDGVYFERAWLTAGLLLPALQAHLARRDDPQLRDHVGAATQALLDRIGRGGQGLPTHWRTTGAQVFAEHREEQTAAAAIELDAFASSDLQRLLRRGSVRSAINAMPSAGDPDLATQFTLLARCDWVWR